MSAYGLIVITAIIISSLSLYNTAKEISFANNFTQLYSYYHNFQEMELFRQYINSYNINSNLTLENMTVALNVSASADNLGIIFERGGIATYTKIGHKFYSFMKIN